MKYNAHETLDPIKLNKSNVDKVAALLKAQSPAKRFDIADTDLPGFRLRVTTSGVLTYGVMYRNREGKRVRFTIGKHGTVTAEQARTQAKDVLADNTKGIDAQAEKKEARQVVAMQTLKEYLDEKYLPWFKAKYKAGTTDASFKSLEEFNEIELDKITAWNIEKWRSKRLKEGVKPGTVNRPLSALKAALNRAVEWSLIESNPLTAVKQIREDALPVVRYLSTAEEKRLRAALDTREEEARVKRERFNKWRTDRHQKPAKALTGVFVDHLKPMVLVAINTGLRRGELFNLQWADVDLKGRNLTVHGTSAKSGRTRHIPLNAEALNTLKDWKVQQADTSGLVFKNRKGGRFDTIKTAWQALLLDAKIKNFRWHDLRHTFASKLVMVGVDLNTVRDLLGHSDLKMTLRYAHLAPEHKAEAVAKLVG